MRLKAGDGRLTEQSQDSEQQRFIGCRWTMRRLREVSRAEALETVHPRELFSKRRPIPTFEALSARFTSTELLHASEALWKEGKKPEIGSMYSLQGGGLRERFVGALKVHYEHRATG